MQIQQNNNELFENLGSMEKFTDTLSNISQEYITDTKTQNSLAKNTVFVNKNYNNCFGDYSTHNSIIVTNIDRSCNITNTPATITSSTMSLHNDKRSQINSKNYDSHKLQILGKRKLHYAVNKDAILKKKRSIMKVIKISY